MNEHIEKLKELRKEVANIYQKLGYKLYELDKTIKKIEKWETGNNKNT